MKRKRHSPEQIIKKLRDADAMLASGKTMGQACQALEVNRADLECSPKSWNAPDFCTRGYESMGWGMGNRVSCSSSSLRVCCWSAGAAGAEAAHAAANWAGVW